MATSRETAYKLLGVLPQSEILNLLDFIAWRGTLVGETEAIDKEWENFSKVYEDAFEEVMRRIDAEQRTSESGA